jgi:hypothetical protein
MQNCRYENCMDIELCQGYAVFSDASLHTLIDEYSTRKKKITSTNV